MDFQFSRKEATVLIIGTALALGSLKADDPWVVLPMLAVSFVAFLYICITHAGPWEWRLLTALAITGAIGGIGLRIVLPHSSVAAIAVVPPTPDPGLTPNPPKATTPVAPPIVIRQRQRELKLIFKDSPLFTPQRKEAMSDRMESFYRYLDQLGLTAPTEIPPIGVGGTNYSSAFVYPGPIYMDTVAIPDNAVDDPKAAIVVYAQYSFGSMLDVHNFNKGNQERRQRAAWIFESYFVSSFSEAQPPPGTGNIAAWAAALWEVRKRFGQHFADAATAFALRAFNDFGDEGGNAKLDLDTYFRASFLAGESVVDNQLGNLQEINTILNEHGLGSKQ